MRVRIKQFPRFFLNLSEYLLSKIIRYIPRKINLWAFGAKGGFRDNPKYLFYQVVENHPEIQPVWISHDMEEYKYLKGRGLPVAYWLSIRGMYYCLRSKVYIVDHATPDINRFLEGGAYYVNLWHGSSVKRVRWQKADVYVREYKMKDDSEMRTSFWFRMLYYPTLFKKPDLCITPSHIQLKEFFAPMMDIPEKNCIVSVFPRSRLMIDGKKAAINFIRKYEPEKTMRFVTMLSKFQKTYIYMPTWRNDGRDFIGQASIDWKQLNDVMKEMKSLFILKLHPFTRLDIGNLSKYSNICIYPKISDVYSVLPFIDCLITDYSSIYTDFLMMNKEIILYVFDYNEFVVGCNDLLEYDKYFVGKRAYDFSQLLHIIESGEDCHVPQDKYHELMEFFWDNNRHQIDIVEEVKKRISL